VVVSGEHLLGQWAASVMFAQSITQVKVAARRRIRTGVRSVGREYFCCACGFVVFIYRGN
jgi:hypothetical protein